MKAKAFELRDRGTFMPAVVVKLEAANEAERYLLRRAGFRNPRSDGGCWILLGALEGGNFDYDKHHTHSSTRYTAIEYIEQHFDELEPGAVICTEHIRGERTEPKISERLEEP